MKLVAPFHPTGTLKSLICGRALVIRTPVRLFSYCVFLLLSACLSSVFKLGGATYSCLPLPTTYTCSSFKAGSFIHSLPSACGNVCLFETRTKVSFPATLRSQPLQSTQTHVYVWHIKSLTRICDFHVCIVSPVTRLNLHPPAVEPVQVREAKTVSTFKLKLKIFLFES